MAISTLKIEDSRLTNPDGDGYVVDWDAIADRHGFVSLTVSGNHTVIESDYGTTLPSLNRLVIYVTAAATIIFPASPELGQVIEVVKTGAGTHTVTIGTNGNPFTQSTNGSISFSDFTLIGFSTGQIAASWRWNGVAWVALSIPKSTGYQSASSLSLGANTVALNATASTADATAFTISQGNVLRRLTGGNITSGKVTDDVSDLTPAAITTMDGCALVGRQLGASGAASSVVINDGEVLRNIGGVVASGKIADDVCAFQSADGLLKLDHVAASNQLTDVINNAANANLDGPTDIADGEYVRITWTILLTISSVDYMADYVAGYKRASGTLTVVQERASFTPPSGVTITANASGSNQPRINIANASGSTLVYYAHYSAHRQVK